MYKVIIDNEEINVSQQDLDNLDISYTQNEYQVLKNNTSFIVSPEDSSVGKKTGSLTINSLKFDFIIKDKYDQLVDKMGLSIEQDAVSSDIAAPMPGLILEILVKPDDEVSEGTSLLILEAMKMENVIKATGSGKVKSINNKVGDTVEKGQVIIEMS